ncbi:hypothetical protein B0H17DRAFT_1143570 [Mycena rosella]|uniref:Uncharacterized protein n=1 Tax=Mycena rosella TaxID=1033263 RepID=A0AAD7CVH0_MYCRO|nr:hypothetical protein B0H17DRAFT_1143570 [Mycena rosella]
MRSHFNTISRRRAKIKALPVDEQEEYHNRAHESRAKYREMNRRYLQIASWDYRNRKYIEMHELHGHIRYDNYIRKSSLRTLRKKKKLAREQVAAQAVTGNPRSLTGMQFKVPTYSKSRKGGEVIMVQQDGQFQSSGFKGVSRCTRDPDVNGPRGRGAGRAKTGGLGPLIMGSGGLGQPGRIQGVLELEWGATVVIVVLMLEPVLEPQRGGGKDEDKCRIEALAQKELSAEPVNGVEYLLRGGLRMCSSVKGLAALDPGPTMGGGPSRL